MVLLYASAHESATATAASPRTWHALRPILGIAWRSPARRPD
ncbi:hypothetical protein ACFVMC_19815 [Nocardia sp. NPDC127579]